MNQTNEIILGTKETPHDITHIVASLSEYKLKVFSDIIYRWPTKFTWSYVDMLGLDPELVVHHLTTDPNVKPVMQKLWKMHPRIALSVKAELKKILEVKFIRPIDYSEWISNIDPNSKLDKSIRVCTDFWDLNKACPKDDFPLPNINILVDLTTGHEMLSLVDAFLGYN